MGGTGPKTSWSAFCEVDLPYEDAEWVLSGGGKGHYPRCHRQWGHKVVGHIVVGELNEV